jgi:hypothetical protein
MQLKGGCIVHVEDFPSQAEDEHRTDRLTTRVEQHFTPAQLAERLALSQTKIRRMFQDEPGVMKIGEPSRRLGQLNRFENCPACVLLHGVPFTGACNFRIETAQDIGGLLQRFSP